MKHRLSRLSLLAVGGLCEVAGCLSTAGWIALATARTALAQSQAPLLVVREDLRLDAEKLDFPDVRQFFISPRGELIVPISQDMQLRRYSAAGRLLETIGRAGGGPGEFRYVGSVGWIGDSMWVRDVSQSRFTVFDSDGKYSRVMGFDELVNGVRLADGSRYLAVQPIALLRDGGALLTGEEATGRTVLIRRDVDGSITTLLDLAERGDPRLMLTAGRYAIPMPFAFQPRLLVSPAGDRAVYVSAQTSPDGIGDVSVRAIRASGGEIFARQLLLRVDRVRPSTRDSALLSILQRRSSEGPNDLSVRLHAIARHSLPEHHASLEFATLGIDGSVWLELRRNGESQRILVLDSLGRDVGVVTLRAGSRVRQATLEALWVTEMDRDGLASIVRYRVTGERRGR